MVCETPCQDPDVSFHINGGLNRLRHACSWLWSVMPCSSVQNSEGVLALCPLCPTQNNKCFLPSFKHAPFLDSTYLCFFFLSIFISAFSFPLPGPYGLFQYTCLCFSVIGPRTLLFSHSDSKRISTSTCQKSKFQLFPQETISFVSYPHQQSISHPTS